MSTLLERYWRARRERIGIGLDMTENGGNINYHDIFPFLIAETTAAVAVIQELTQREHDGLS